jgi:hypothetical protein
VFDLKPALKVILVSFWVIYSQNSQILSPYEFKVQKWPHLKNDILAQISQNICFFHLKNI